MLEAEADQGVAPVIVMPAVPKTDRRRYVTTRDLVKCGWADECQACTPLAVGMHNAKVPYDDRCRYRIGELMAGDDDQRQVERMMSRTISEVETRCPEAGEGPATVSSRRRPATASTTVSFTVSSQVRVGGSSSSGTRAGSDDDGEVKRVRFAESRGQKRQGENMEELVTKVEEQHLDVDVEVPAHKSWRIEDASNATDAVDAAPEQMNSFLQNLNK